MAAKSKIFPSFRDAVAEAVPELARTPDGIDRAAVEITALIDVTAAALLLDDPSVIGEQRGWAEALDRKSVV